LTIKLTYFIFIFRNKILPTAYSPSPLISSKKKARKQAPLGQLELYRQKPELSWKSYRPYFIKTQLNWSTILTQPKPCSRPLEAKFLPMLKKHSSMLHI
jgi:hypothetical protein